MISLPTFLEENHNKFKTIYYPGSGTDYSVMELFAEYAEVSNIYYADYGEEMKGYGLATFSNIDYLEECELPFCNYYMKDLVVLNPQDLNKNSWLDFWPDNLESKKFGKPENGWGASVKMKCHSDWFSFIYLGTEGIQTAEVLLSNNIFLDVVVLQEHGCGGNWSHFGGANSPLYHTMQEHLPEYILMEPDSNTEIWPGYIQVTEPYLPPLGRARPQHANARALFRKQEG
jgi:hypothetical protein